ncbi:MAG: type IV secretory system conjugative DNA transfer family protein [Gemmatimonadales bacterium]|nr:type IV secretory system conjugative DNA transfer family protein [Gemmatimonadales bacterium]
MSPDGRRLPDTWASMAGREDDAAGARRQRPMATLKMPDSLGTPGLLIGWSLEMERGRRPMGFGAGDAQRAPRSGYIDPILMETDGHLITVAPTGAGKGVGCIIPALLRYDGPIIAIDPKGENVAITARRRRELGHQVIVLDPIGITDQPAAALNPLDMLDPTSATTVDEAAALAGVLIDHRQDEKNRFWYERAAHLLFGVILHTIADYPVEERNLNTVRNLIGLSSGDPDKLIEAMRISVHPEARAVAQSLAVGAAETRGSIVAVAQDGVDFLRGPLVQNAIRETTFDLDDVTLGKPLSIYIVVPPHMLESHGKLLRLWIATLMTAITRRRSRAKQATLFLLDEAAQLGTLPQLRQAITLLRGYGMRTWSFWQDLSQLRLLYPSDWQTMVNNCQVLQCFGAFNSLAARDLHELTGFGTPDAIVDLENHEMILQISGDQPVIARVPNYRFDPPFKGLFDANPYFDPDQNILPKDPPRIRLFERPEPAVPAPLPVPAFLSQMDEEEESDEAAEPVRVGETDRLLQVLLAGWGDTGRPPSAPG